MAEIMETLTGLSFLVFVIGSLASMGLSLKMKQLIEPLKPLAVNLLNIVENVTCKPSRHRRIRLVE